ncbi:vitamin K epoxide reductase family protein [Candidatus Woesearchaeota archaeon]|nr:vitamin K epoxide reductase family protein [Candidatus Woesearchaeota archaeon]
MQRKTLRYLFLIIGIIGLVLSLYLVKHHYIPEPAFCDVNALISCSTVNTSMYSEIYHVPVAFFGVVWFLGLIGFSFLLKKRKYEMPFFVWCSLGLLSLIYFIYGEIVLEAICLWCTSVHVLVLVTFILAIVLYRKMHSAL